jgi:tRNA threonylcarbamoyladenosine biosynthesis protein TsaE
MEFTVENEGALAEKVWGLLKNQISDGFCVGISGELGSGKTTLVSAIAKKIGIKETVTSPTFNIVKNYNVPDGPNGVSNLCHVDLYRLEHHSKYDELEISESIAKQGNITFVEWPEIMINIDRLMSKKIQIVNLGQSRRKVIINDVKD